MRPALFPAAARTITPAAPAGCRRRRPSRTFLVETVHAENDSGRNVPWPTPASAPTHTPAVRREPRSTASEHVSDATKTNWGDEDEAVAAPTVRN